MPRDVSYALATGMKPEEEATARTRRESESSVDAETGEAGPDDSGDSMTPAAKYAAAALAATSLGDEVKAKLVEAVALERRKRQQIATDEATREEFAAAQRAGGPAVLKLVDRLQRAVVEESWPAGEVDVNVYRALCNQHRDDADIRDQAYWLVLSEGMDYGSMEGAVVPASVLDAQLTTAAGKAATLRDAARGEEGAASPQANRRLRVLVGSST